MPSIKHHLLNYLQFLKESGCLYLEGPLPALTFATNPGPARKSSPPAPSGGSLQPGPMASAARPARPARSAQPNPSAPPDLFAPTATPSRPTLDPAFGPPPLPREQRLDRMREAIARAEACRACALGATRKRLVYGDGSPEASIMFVGEAPGGDEDAQGIPFVGRAGQLLNKMLAAIGFQREEVYICNTLKCRPPDNRDPLPNEKAACEHFLVEQLALVQPKILVALGAHAAQYLCRSDLPIGRLRGHWHSYHGIPLLATYHPAFLLRSPGFKPRAWEDFQMIHAKYAELRPDDPRKIWRKEADG